MCWVAVYLAWFSQDENDNLVCAGPLCRKGIPRPANVSSPKTLRLGLQVGVAPMESLVSHTYRRKIDDFRVCMPIKKCGWRHCSFSFSCTWTARLMNYLWPTVCKFPIPYSNIDCCNTPSSRWQRHPHNSQLWINAKPNAWSTTNEVTTTVAGKFTYTMKLSTIQSKRHCSFSLSCEL